MWQAVNDFFVSLFEGIANLITWIGELATEISSIDLNSGSIVKVLGMFRYLAGDTVYLGIVTGMYIGLLLIAIKIIPIFVSWWKHFSPFHSK